MSFPNNAKAAKSRTLMRLEARAASEWRSTPGSASMTPSTVNNHWQSSVLSHLRLCNSLPAAADLIEDYVGGGLPNEGLRLVVPCCEPLVDGLLQFRHAAES